MKKLKTFLKDKRLPIKVRCPEWNDGSYILITAKNKSLCLWTDNNGIDFFENLEAKGNWQRYSKFETKRSLRNKG